MTAAKKIPVLISSCLKSRGSGKAASAGEEWTAGSAGVFDTSRTALLACFVAREDLLAAVLRAVVGAARHDRQRLSVGRDGALRGLDDLALHLAGAFRGSDVNPFHRHRPQE